MIARRYPLVLVSVFSVLGTLVGVGCGSDGSGGIAGTGGRAGGSAGRWGGAGASTVQGGTAGAGVSPGAGGGVASGGGSLALAGSTGNAGTTGNAGPNSGGGVAGGGWRWLGRVDAANSRFGWSGSGLVATVNGARISVSLKSEGDTLYLAVIDGSPQPRFKVATGTQTVTLAEGLTATDHRVELYRETEGMMGSSVFQGFTEGTVQGAPPYGGRLLEVVGDSISCGYGNLGNDVHPPWDVSCGYTIDTQSAYQSYGAQLARQLDAEVSIVCRSGWGLYRDLSGSSSNVLPTLFDRSVNGSDAARWDFARKPDGVVINLGTNDSNANAGGDPGVPYEDASVAFIQSVRGHYPSAWIFLTIGTMTSDPMLAAMQTHLDNVVTRAGDSKVVAIRLTTQNAAATGCDYHPNVAEDTRIAASLVPVIRQSLGW